jgi:excisionase family DNA binding protein
MPESNFPPVDNGEAPPITTSNTWTVALAARIFDVSTAWLYKLVDANEMPHKRLGTYIFFDRHELSAWLSRFRGKSR